MFRLQSWFVPEGGLWPRFAVPSWRGVWGLCLLWHERARGRRYLARLDDRMLQDIGLSRADAAGETAKPFWRP